MKLPFLTWIPYTDTATIIVTVSGTPYNVPIDFSNTWGFGVGVGPNFICPTDTIPGRLAAAIDAYVGGAPVQAKGDISDFTVGPSLYSITMPATAATVTFPSLAVARRFGFNTTTVTFAAGATTSSTQNVAGVWSPNGTGTFTYSVPVQRAAASSSDMAASFTDVISWGSVTNWIMESTAVPAAQVLSNLATDPTYAAQANRVITDANNTLDVAVAAAAQGRQFRLYVSAGSYNAVRWPDVASKPSSMQWATWKDKPRLFDTSLTLRGA